MRVIAIIFLLAAAALDAQTAFEISGVLLDKATNQGIAGATVMMQWFPGDPTLPPINGQATTNVLGEFRFQTDREGRYAVGTMNVPGYQVNAARVTLSAANPKVEVRLLLDRDSQARGRVIDAETGDSAAGLTLRLPTVRYLRGRLSLTTPGTAVTTNGEGRFENSDTISGRRVARIVPRLWTENPRHLTTFTERDFQQTDEDYEESFWPGGGGLETALALNTVPETPIDFGTIRARKTTYYRARVHLAPGSCQANDAFEAELFRRSGEDRIEEGRFDLACGQDVLLRALAGGGSYVLSLLSKEKPLDQNTYLTLAFNVADRNLELTAAPARGMDLDGRVVLADGARSWPPGMRAVLIDWRGLARQTVSVDAEGRFRFLNAPQGENSVAATELGSAHVITAARFAGVPIAVDPPRKFEWTGRGSLEIVVDDQPAAVAGTVMDGNRAMNQALVFLYPWPLTSSRGIVSGNAEGKFQWASIRPGEYRVLAIPPEARERFEEPGVMERLLPRAERVAVQRGGSVSVTLPLLDPR